MTEEGIELLLSPFAEVVPEKAIKTITKQFDY